MLSMCALAGLPEIEAGMDLGALIAERGALREGDVVVVAHKAVSKAEGRVRRLDDVTPGSRAVELAAVHDKDPRYVQVVLDETREVLRAERGVLICVTRHGFVCANAGVDASNAGVDRAGGAESLILLPVDPDASARSLRARLRELTGASPAVVISDSFGRAWRHGQTDIAIGVAGLAPLDDWRGRVDSVGRELRATWIALADEIAGAADLVRTKDSREPVVIISGLNRHVLPPDDDGPGAAALVRPASEDLFR
jgi:coenzyme F420-0:L-glutamate ligase/coenzyme F420-1:gamma-L-glutamate ligase